MGRYTHDPLTFYIEEPQEGFISDETRHEIDYIKYNIPSKKYAQAESYFEEDKKDSVGIDIPCCRLNRH